MSIRYLSGINVDNNVLFVDDVNNRVGIGTGSPNSALEISQVTPIVRIESSDVNQFHGIEFRNGGNLDAFIKQLPQTGEFRISNGRGASWGGHITLYTDTVERLRITAAGNVGIGTTSPADKLHVIGNVSISNNSFLKILDTAGNPGFTLQNTSSNVAVIRQNNSGALKYWAGFASDANNAHIFAVGADTEIVRFTNAGNVGIGTTAPGAPLSVAGVGGSTKGTNGYIVHIGGTDGNVDPVRYMIGFSHGNTYTAANVRAALGMMVTTGGAGNLVFETGLGGAGQLERMRINGDGNVGIGTTSPVSLLHVNGSNNTTPLTINAGSNATFEFKGNSTSGYTTTFNINDTALYIGHNSASRDLVFQTHSTDRLTISGSGAATFSSTVTATNYYASNGGAFGWGDASTRIDGDSSNQYIRVVINSSEKLRITPAGNVGIGTTSPGAKLHVYTPSSGTAIVVGRASGNSSIKASADADGGYLSLDSTGTATIINHYVSDNVWLVTGGGNVGIGTTAPFSRLTVSGALTSSASQISIVNTEGGHAIIRSGIAGVSNNGISFITAAVDGTSQVNNMVIDASGEVGIGTTQPMGPLEVYKSNSGGLGGHIILNNNGLAVGNETAILFGDSGVGSANGIRAAISSTVEGAPYRGDIKFKTGVTTYGGLSTTMIITGAGNVGIGTTAPAAKLHVNPATVNEIAIAINGTQNYSANSFQRISAGDASSLNRVAIGFGYNSTPEWTIRYSSYHNHEFFTGNDWGSSTEKMRITSAGNVGIGTTAPKSKLQIVGPTLTTNNENTYALWVSDTGDDTKGLLLGYDLVNDVGVIQAVDQATSWKSISIASNGGNVSIGTTTNTGARTNIFLSEAGATPNAILRLQNTGSQYLAKMILTDGNTNDAVIGYQGGVTSATQYLGFGLGTAITQMILTAAGNVGIGTTSPAQKLDVEGSVRATGGGFEPSTSAWINAAFTTKINGSPYGGGLALIDGTTGWAQYTIGSGANLVFAYGATSGATSEKMRITSAGNVGIGTTAPVSNANRNTLALQGAWGGQLDIMVGAAVHAQFGTDNFSSGLSCRIQSADGIVFKTNATEHLRITSAGNVGINTTNPTERLDVDGNGKLRGNLYLTAANPYIEGSGTGAMRIKHTDGQVMYIRPDQTGNVVFFEGASGQTVDMVTATPSVNSTQNSSSALTFEARARNAGGTLNIKSTSLQNTVYDIASNLSRFSITGQNVLYLDGNVGVGTNTPLSRLHTKGEIRIEDATDTTTRDHILKTETTGALSFTDSVSGERMRIDYNGKVGINTTGPGGLLGLGVQTSVQGTNGITLGVNDNNIEFVHAVFGNGFGSKFYSVDSGSGVTSLRIAGRGNSTSWSDLVTILVTDSASTRGNVGIGTTAPTAKLQAVGTSTYNSDAVKAFRVSDSTTITKAVDIGFDAALDAGFIQAGNFGVAYKHLLLQPNNNNVGIGTTAPTEKLHVAGSTLITYNNSFQSTNSVGNKAILARVSPTAGIVNYAEYATATNLNGFVIGSDDARVKGNIATDSLEFITNTSTRMTILSGGNVGINTTTPGSTLHVIGDVLIQTGALGVGVNPNATDGRIDASNDIVAFSTSDRRLKENITPIANALEKVKSLTGVEFDWKEETKSVHGYEGHDVGIIAQDVQAVLPEAVRTNDSGYLSVRYEKMIALLVEANKELADRVEQLEKLIK